MIFYGRNVTIEALRSPFYKEASFVYLQEGISKDEKISEIIQLSAQHKIPLKYISRGELSKRANSDEHQGVLIELNYNFAKLSSLLSNNNSGPKTFIYISVATYEHNIGAIARSAEVAGFDGVIIPKQAQITPTVARTSVGAIFHIPIARESIFNTIKMMQSNNVDIYGIERDGTMYTEENMTYNDCMFIIGGEDKSLSESVRKKCTTILEIPQFGKVNSLNMSVAASIVMFERVRQSQYYK